MSLTMASSRSVGRSMSKGSGPPSHTVRPSGTPPGTSISGSCRTPAAAVRSGPWLTGSYGCDRGVPIASRVGGGACRRMSLRSFRRVRVGQFEDIPKNPADLYQAVLQMAFPIALGYDRGHTRDTKMHTL